MKHSHLDIHGVLGVLETVGILTCTWPINPKDRGPRTFLRNLFWRFTVINFVIFLAPQVLYAYHFRNETTHVMKSLSQINACSETFVNLLLSRHLNLRLQNLVTKMKRFLKTAEKHEQIILQKHVDRYLTFFEIIVASAVMCGTAFIFSPFFLDTDFPADSVFPFPTDAIFVKYLIYVLQVICVMEVVSCYCVDFTIATFLSFCSARIDMLILELENVTENDQLVICIKKHQEIIEFVKETEQAVRHLFFKTNITMSLTVITGAIPLLHKQPAAVTSRFVTMVIAALQKLYIIVWPAEDLRAISLKVAPSVYGVPWIGKSKSMGTHVGMMILRSQKALVLSITFFPAPCFESFAAFLKVISSYFMGIRTMIED